MKNMISDQKTVPVPGRGKKSDGEKILRGKKAIIALACILLAVGVCSAGVIGSPLEAEGTALQTSSWAMATPCYMGALGEKAALAKTEEATEKILKKVSLEADLKEVADKDVLQDEAGKEPLKKEETVTSKTENAGIEVTTPERELQHENELSELMTVKETEKDSANDDGEAATIEETEEKSETIEKAKMPGEEVETDETQEEQDAGAEDDEKDEGENIEDDGQLFTPVEGFIISSPFGPRWGRLHTGIDMALAQGNPIYAAGSGTVIFSGYNGGYGNLVKIDHGNGMQTYYAHCSQLLVTQGQQVERGETIARVGSTGNSTGPHVHFEVIVDGSCVDPASYLDLE